MISWLEKTNQNEEGRSGKWEASGSRNGSQAIA